MSLLDKQEVQDICEHTALRARKWSGFICKRASEIQQGLLKKEEKEENQIESFYFVGCIRNFPLYSDVIHSFDWKSAIDHNSGFKYVIVYLARDIPVFVMYCVYGASCLSLLIESIDSMIQN